MSTESASTADLPARPLGVRLYNGVGRLLRRCGWRRPLDAERILASACRRTGLHDFGEVDVREPLRRLVGSLEDENHLTPLGRLLIHREFVQLAAARLGVTAALKEHPEILGEEVSRPLFVLGLPRTGSTLLQRLLAQDPDSRPLYLWEMVQPAPGSPHRDRLVRRLRRNLAFLTRYLAPRFQSIHPVDAEAPEECRLLLMNTFRSPGFGSYGNVRGYREWLQGLGDENTRGVYREYRKQLQLLQWGRPPRRWVLKAPIHAYGLHVLLQLFPDACVVQTHRDLAEVLSSHCSLALTMKGVYSDGINPHQMAVTAGQHIVDRILRPALRARESHPGRIKDVAYRDLVADPVGTARSIYERFGLPWTAGAEGKMREWLAANPQGKHGRHRYSLEQFGLDRDAVGRLFPGYPQCFGLPPEAL